MGGSVKVRLSPLQAYFLGGEQNSGFGEKRTAPYFIRSETIPFQTTLLGLSRYCVLQNAGALTPQFGEFEARQLSRELKDRQIDLVGKSSFSFEENEIKSFGCIIGLSPLFMEKDGVLYARCPYNHVNCSREGYKPFTMQMQSDFSSNKKQWIPLDYTAKWGVYQGWISLDGQKNIVSDMDVFLSQVQTGIQISPDGVPESGFFKKEYKRLKDGWSFVFFAEVKATDALPLKTIVRMGQGASLFEWNCQPDKTDWRNLLQFDVALQEDYDGVIYAAISDCRPNCAAQHLYDLCDFVITKVRPFRSLCTRQDRGNYYESMGKTKRVDLLRSGSVFYVSKVNQRSFKAIFACDAYSKIGFNQIAIIGGIHS